MSNDRSMNIFSYTPELITSMKVFGGTLLTTISAYLVIPLTIFFKDWIGLIERNQVIIEFIGNGFQYFAWFGVGITGVVVGLKFIIERFKKKKE